MIDSIDDGRGIPVVAGDRPDQQIAFAEDRLRLAVRVTADRVVGGSLVLPQGKKAVTITSSVTDNYGKKGTTRSILAVSDVVSGQSLTPNP